MNTHSQFYSLTALLMGGALLAIMSSSCAGRPPNDSYCSYEPLPASVDAKADQGALEVEGITSTYFYVFDEGGKQNSYQSLGRTLGLDPGKYQLKVNNSSHPITVQKGILTKCSTGALMVSGGTPEYYYVMDSANQQLHYDSLGKAASFLPAPFRVRVNNTEVQTEVKLNQTTEIKTGTLVVRGSTNEYYYVNDSLGKQLSYNSLEKPLAFLPGSYTVRVNNTESKANIGGGQITELKTGTLLVKGSTEEYYYVLDSLGKQLGYQNLNKALAFFTGGYRVRVNNSDTTAEVVAGEIRECETGSLTVAGNGSEYYYVLDKTGSQLNYNSLNKPLSFFPSGYTVKLGQSTQPATVTAGKATTVKF